MKLLILTFIFLSASVNGIPYGTKLLLFSGCVNSHSLINESARPASLLSTKQYLLTFNL